MSAFYQSVLSCFSATYTFRAQTTCAFSVKSKRWVCCVYVNNSVSVYMLLRISVFLMSYEEVFITHWNLTNKMNT